MPRGAPASIRHSRRRPAPWLAVAILSLMSAMVGLPAYDGLRERTFDALLVIAESPRSDPRIVIVDIDRRALERFGTWPWSRERLAAVLNAVAVAQPAVVGVDILLDGEDRSSPAALARQLAATVGSDQIIALADRLPDGDRLIARAVAGTRTVLGAALDPDRLLPPSVQPPPVIAMDGARLPELWEARGLIAPPRQIAAAASGIGVMALAADSDGRVRRVPLLVRSRSGPQPGLALEIVRIQQAASAYLLAPNGELRIGNLRSRINAGGMMRLQPSLQTPTIGTRISAADLEQLSAKEQISGRIVLVGGSAPELGGLRSASYGRLRASVDIQAEAITQLLAGTAPHRPGMVLMIELIACLMAGIAAFALAQRRNPLASAAMMLCAAAGWVLISISLAVLARYLLDPIAVPAAGIVSFAITTLFAASETRRRADALRRRFEQHLAPELVSRIIENPDLVKFAGEQRQTTILFTDIEGFTAMTERADPVELIGALDRYLEELSRIVIEHGGMVEKVVGDGMHALFNAPLDLPGHADRAVDCALAIEIFAQQFMRNPEISALGFGRTRIGIETGSVIIGDVGGGARLDYTAYGNAMNTAARLEAANKALGTSICIGETTAAMLVRADRLRPLGEIEIRGRNERLKVFDVWPPDMTDEQKARYSRACALLSEAPDRANEILRPLAAERPHDLAISCLIERTTSS